jgi:hypothetical protein
LNRNSIISFCFGLALPVYVAVAILFQSFGPGWFVIIVCILCPLAGAFFGHAALREARRNDGASFGGQSLARTGLGLGYGEIVLLAIVVAGSGHHPNRMAAYEAAAVGSMRTLNFAAHAYANSHPRVGFPNNLKELAWDNSKPETPSVVDPALASGLKLHYRFTYLAKSTKGDGVEDAYQVFADPVDATNKEMRHFYTDQTEVIRVSSKGSANETSPAI